MFPVCDQGIRSRDPPPYTHLLYRRPDVVAESHPVAHSLCRRGVGSTAHSHCQLSKAPSSAGDACSPTLTCARPCYLRCFSHHQLLSPSGTHLLSPTPLNPTPRLTIRGSGQRKRQRCAPASHTDIRPLARPDAHLLFARMRCAGKDAVAPEHAAQVGKAHKSAAK